MSHVSKTLNALSKLLSYPDPQALQTAEFLFVVLQGELPEAARAAANFGAFVERSETWELEEAFTRTFDVNPTCALEVGWHLFGEEYARGMFLVRMREEMRKYELPESTELPDHISHVLAIVSAMPDEEATRFVRACVQPAVEKMSRALTGKGTPYADVVLCLALVLRHVWGEPNEDDASADPSRTGRRSSLGGDPLRDYPVAGVMAGGQGPDGKPLDLVPLTLSASLQKRATNDSITPPVLSPPRPS